MLKKLVIPSISVLAIAIGVRPAHATEASPNLANSSTSSGLQVSKIPLSLIKPAEEKPKVFTLTMGLERGSNVIADDSDLDKTTTTLLINPKLNLTDKLSLSSKTFVEKQENGPGNTEASDTQITLSLKGAKWGESLQPSYSLSGFAPSSESNRKDTRFQGAGGLGFKLAGSYTFADVSYGLSYRRNVHEFTVSADGSANIRETVSQVITLDIPVTQKWSLSFAGGYKNAWTYQNSNRQSYTIDGDINFEAIKDLTINLGASNEGSALKANGKDSNISFYDDKSSVIRLGVTYVL